MIKKFIAKARRQRVEGLLLVCGRLGCQICPNLYGNSYNADKIVLIACNPPTEAASATTLNAIFGN
jgi:hypothetical protein